MDEVLRDAVLQRLAQLEKAAEHGEAEALVPLARAEINRLADGWRLLLEVHQPDEDSRCEACPGWWRHRRWPCQVWNTAHRHLIGEGVPHRERRRPLRAPFTRSRVIGVPAETTAETTAELPISVAAPRVVPEAPVVSRPKHALRD
ncbi:hypothetical protein [Lentzea sp. NPDC060358]|uniref:hypothetical protein n=1 Tax=Lentzea sp. NPDC060358 TaxID=3347103 RepID=UPI003650DAEC